eukprot:Trichotokara_eunicae@DN3536_c0_g1_i1.p1
MDMRTSSTVGVYNPNRDQFQNAKRRSPASMPCAATFLKFRKVAVPPTGLSGTGSSFRAAPVDTEIKQPGVGRLNVSREPCKLTAGPSPLLRLSMFLAREELKREGGTL